MGLLMAKAKRENGDGSSNNVSAPYIGGGKSMSQSSHSIDQTMVQSNSLDIYVPAYRHNT